MALSAVIGFTGAILLLIGLVGGGFTFSGSIFPKVGKIARVPCLLVGGLLIFVALGLASIEAGLVQPDPASTPAANTQRATETPDAPQPPVEIRDSPVDEPAGSLPVGVVNIDVDIYEEPYLDAYVVGRLAAGELVEIGCTVQGEVVVNGEYASSLWNQVGDGYVPDVAIYTGTDQAVAPSC